MHKRTLHRWLRLGMLCIAMSACGKKPRTLLVYDALPTTLNPLYASVDQDFRAQALVYERIFFTERNEAKPKSDLVLNYAYRAPVRTKTAAELVMTLREDRRWANGKPVVPDDLCFTINALLNPDNDIPWAKEHREVLAGCVMSGDEVVVAFKHRVPSPTDWLMVPLLPSHRFDSTTIPRNHLAATSAYGVRNTRATLHNTQVVVRSVKKKEAPNIQRLEIHAPKDADWTLEQLEIGQAQGMVSLSSEYWSRAEEDITLSTIPFDPRTWWFIAVNTQTGLGTELQFRHALDLYLSRDQLLQGIQRGPLCSAGSEHPACMKDDAATPTTQLISGPFVRNSPHYNDAVPVVDADAAQAAGLLEALGLTFNEVWMHAEVPITLRIGISEQDDARQPGLLNAVSETLQSAGFMVTTDVVAGAWPGRNEAIASQFDLFIGRWRERNPSPQIHHLLGADGADNLFGYTDPELEGLFAERFALNPSRGSDVRWMYPAHARLAETRPLLFLWSTETQSVWRKEFRGNLKPSPFEYYADFMNWAWLRPWVK